MAISNLLPPNIKIANDDGTATQELLRCLQGLDAKATAAQNAAAQSSIRNLFTAMDGAYTDFRGFYTKTPSLIEFDLSALPTPPSGQAYVTQALNLDKDGFDASIKLVTTGAIADQTTGLGVDDGTGKYVCQKPVSADAYNKIYNFIISGEMGSVYYNTWVGVYVFQVYYNSEWITLQTVNVQTSDPADVVFTNFEYAIEIPYTIGLATSPLPEFRVIPYQGIVNSLEVTYQTRADSSVTPVSGVQVKVWVTT